MKLSISNIAWPKEYDQIMYKKIHDLGYAGLEIAPTRLFPNNPYEMLNQAKEYAQKLKEEYKLEIPSMQSIWYGRNEKIWGQEEERKSLLEYTRKAILFASAIGCKNLVFGCPKNRFKPDDGTDEIAISFFKEISDFAYDYQTCIGLEANPVIYNTNFINTTKEALEFVRTVKSPGLKLNLDLGTMIYNDENTNMLLGEVELVNHVHISEPGLKEINKRKIHNKLYELLLKGGYDGYISIEMNSECDFNNVEKHMKYIKDVFG